MLSKTGPNSWRFWNPWWNSRFLLLYSWKNDNERLVISGGVIMKNVLNCRKPRCLMEIPFCRPISSIISRKSTFLGNFCASMCIMLSYWTKIQFFAVNCEKKCSSKLKGSLTFRLDIFWKPTGVRLRKLTWLLVQFYPRYAVSFEIRSALD